MGRYVGPIQPRGKHNRPIQTLHACLHGRRLLLMHSHALLPLSIHASMQEGQPQGTRGQPEGQQADDE